MADQYGVEPGEVLSLDGKTLRGIHGEEIPGVHLVSAYAVRGGAVLAQAAAPGKGQELEAAKEVLGLVPLQGRVVVADALLTQREVCEQIVAGGGDYLLPVKRRGTVGLFRPGVKRLCRQCWNGGGSLAAPTTGVPGGAAAGSERQD